MKELKDLIISKDITQKMSVSEMKELDNQYGCRNTGNSKVTEILGDRMYFYEISEEEYKELLRDSKILEVLKERGVENWDGYEDAIKENEEYINDYDDILDEMPIRIGYDINIEWIENIEELRLANEIVVVTKVWLCSSQTKVWL